MQIDTFDAYQAEARKTAFCPAEHKITYPAIGLAAEAGELANKVKKLLRGDSNRDELLDGVKAEMGDILWYLAALADDLGVSLSEVAGDNIEKLAGRYARGTLRGAGDTR